MPCAGLRSRFLRGRARRPFSALKGRRPATGRTSGAVTRWGRPPLPAAVPAPGAPRSAPESVQLPDTPGEQTHLPRGVGRVHRESGRVISDAPFELLCHFVLVTFYSFVCSQGDCHFKTRSPQMSTSPAECRSRQQNLRTRSEAAPSPPIPRKFSFLNTPGPRNRLRRGRCLPSPRPNSSLMRPMRPCGGSQVGPDTRPHQWGRPQAHGPSPLDLPCDRRWAARPPGPVSGQPCPQSSQAPPAEPPPGVQYTLRTGPAETPAPYGDLCAVLGR